MKKLDNIRETQIAIKILKDHFEKKLAAALNLLRVSAPLFVKPLTGLNDNLTGVEIPVTFRLHKVGFDVEIVQSLAKWKRDALARYDIPLYEGLYTDMNAVRAFEDMDATHSVYVDQWDWELHIAHDDRNENFLRSTVRKIFNAFKETEDLLLSLYPELHRKLPEDIVFLTTEELRRTFPDLEPKAREREITRRHKAVFLMQIGKTLSDGTVHDKRSPDYDDWELNGDILFWNPALDDALELSSMGVRVDAPTLLRQLEISDCMQRLPLPYHKNIVADKLPQCIGGGIGQSRICMYFLEKRHIGEVQASTWSDEIIENSRRDGIVLL